MSAEEKCPTCKGKGRWQVREKYSDGETALVWYECGDCHGTGVKTDEVNDTEGEFSIGEMVEDDE